MKMTENSSFIFGGKRTFIFGAGFIFGRKRKTIFGPSLMVTRTHQEMR